MDPIVRQSSSGRRPKIEGAIWGFVLIGWFIALCVVPDPRPLGAPEWSVRLFQSSFGIAEPAARAVATIVLRAAGLAVIGVLASLAMSNEKFGWAAMVSLVISPLLAVTSLWINYEYFPIHAQLQLALASAVMGTLAGLSLRRNRLAAATLVIIAVGLFAWGSSTGIPDDLDALAQETGEYVLVHAAKFPPGDEGFNSLLRSAFMYAEDNSHGSDAVLPNKAAILALGVILGEETVAKVAKRRIDLNRLPEYEALRNRITLRGRGDLARHFWVSAALAVLSDQDRSMTVGIVKEMMDATPGGSGFSFVDLTADRAGTLFTNVATANAESAREIQMRVRRGVISEELCPDISGLPEGITRDEFQTEYGGLGGAGTGKVVTEIRRRLDQCEILAAKN